MGLSSKDLARLGPHAQKQVLQKLGAQQRQRESKYHNSPTERITPSGNVLHFDSQKEARRYDTLISLQNQGQIRDLRLQVDFTLQEAYTDPEGRRVRAIRYRADFTYKQRNLAEESLAASKGWPCESWRLVVEDVKSQATKTDKYKIKAKLFRERYGFAITEI